MLAVVPSIPPPSGDPVETMFVLVLTYVAPLEAIDAALADHRLYLDRHFASGEFLASGPRQPRVGGVILARAESRKRVEELVAEDPFAQQGLARYEVIEFAPTRGPFAGALLAGTPAGTPGGPPAEILAAD